MIDKSNEIFHNIAYAVRAAHTDVTVTGEYTRKPSKFPTVTVDETDNVTIDHLEDSSNEENFAGLTYRIQIFSNKQSGKRAEARQIFTTVDTEMRRMGFRRITYSVMPEIYDATIYSITVTYEAVVSAAGYVYKR